MAKTYYQLLGVPNDASPDEIRKAYRKAMRENHPDQNPDSPKAGQRSRQLNNARATLLDNEKRAKYDEKLKRRGLWDGEEFPESGQDTHDSSANATYGNAGFEHQYHAQTSTHGADGFQGTGGHSKYGDSGFRKRKNGRASDYINPTRWPKSVLVVGAIVSGGVTAVFLAWLLISMGVHTRMLAYVFREQQAFSKKDDSSPVENSPQTKTNRQPQQTPELGDVDVPPEKNSVENDAPDPPQNDSTPLADNEVEGTESNGSSNESNSSEPDVDERIRPDGDTPIENSGLTEYRYPNPDRFLLEYDPRPRIGNLAMAASAVAPFDAETARVRQLLWAEYLQVPLEFTDQNGIEFVLIPAGRFMMGTSQSEIDRQLEIMANSLGADRQAYVENLVRSSSPQFPVATSQAYYMSKREISRDQFNTMFPGGSLGGQHPMTNVSWNKAADFCDRLNRNSVNPNMYYRLPTSSQWEMAGLAGSTNDSPADLIGIESTSASNPLDIQQNLQAKGDNPWGLSGMYDEIGEWVSDWKTEYDNLPKVEPDGAASGELKTIRGRFNDVWPGRACSTALEWAQPDAQSSQVGFRVVMEFNHLLSNKTGNPVPSSDQSDPELEDFNNKHKLQLTAIETFEGEQRFAMFGEVASQLLLKSMHQNNERMRYEMLKSAVRCAIESGEPLLTYQCIDEMATVFDVDDIKIKKSALNRWMILASEQFEKDEYDAKVLVLCGFFFELANDALENNRFEQAVELYKFTAEMLAEDDERQTIVQTKLAEAQSKLDRHNSFEALAVEAENTGDPNKFLDVGKYWALELEDWGRGVPYLAKSSNTNFKRGAEIELANPQTIEQINTLADIWFDFGMDPLNEYQTVFAKRALFWYGSTLKQASSDQRESIVQRIELLARQIDPADLDFRWINALHLVDPKANSIGGSWTKNEVTNAINIESGGKANRIHVPINLGTNYQLKVKFSLDGSRAGIIIPIAGKPCLVDFGRNVRFRLYKNKHLQKTPFETTEGVAHVVNVSVLVRAGKAYAVGSLDGEIVFDWSGDPNQITLDGVWDMKGANRFGLVSSDNSVVVYHDVHFKSID